MAETIDDEYLVKQFIRGDKSSFETILKRHSADVAILANRLLGWPGEVEDIVQDVFLSAFMGLRKFRCECSLKTWLFTITINRCRSYRYKRLLRLKIFSQVAAESSFTKYQSGDKSSMDFEIFNRVRQAVKTLPVKCREPIVLKYLHELPTDEICGILGISNNALQVRLHRARLLLKHHLAELIEKD